LLLPPAYREQVQLVQRQAPELCACQP
jgi:hypothetical protein